ncbi:UNVERIFIED_CONTAM: hypothetical protein Sradi_0673600 [Sesamum radiatum]|uniref:Uncharacterized protein n=1 Tax=Sesamum radiatum TaxID=300843 RepID=A0AAW2VMZ1_SESRA
MTSIWNTTNFVETLGTIQPKSENPAARSPRMPSLGTCRLLPIYREKPRNVRLRLFAQTGLRRTDSIIVLIYVGPLSLRGYNLPPGMCMSFEYMFLTMVISGPSNAKHLIDVYLEPLIEELL